MKTTSYLMPLKWYDNYSNQRRNTELYNLCEFKIVTGINSLIPFQIKRISNPYLVKKFILRKSNNDSVKEILNETETRFLNSWTNAGAWISLECGGIKAYTLTNWPNKKICYNGLIAGKKYTIKFKIINITPNAVLKLYNDNSVINNYTINGSYTITFIANSNNVCFEYDNTNTTTELILDHCQIYLQQDFTNDILLNTNLLEIKTDNVYDYIINCPQQLQTQIPEGCYYYVIEDFAGNNFFSDNFIVMNFKGNDIIKIKWYNNCDMADVIYTNTTKKYYNELYLLESDLKRAKYEYKIENEQNGEGLEVAVQKNLEKNIELNVYAVPETIADSLSGIPLHQFVEIELIEGKNNNKQQTEIIKPINVEFDTTPVFDDYSNNIKLTCKLEHINVGNCCKQISQSCFECQINIPGIGIYDQNVSNYALNNAGGLYSLFIFQNGNWDTMLGTYIGGIWVSETIPVNTIVCIPSQNQYWQLTQTQAVQCPLFQTITLVGDGVYHVKGNVITNSFAVFEYYDGIAWIETSVYLTAQQFLNGTNIQLFNSATCCPFNVRVRMKSFDCEYGLSNILLADSDNNNCC